MQNELLEENFAFASPRGTITRWGSGAARLFGVAADDMAGRSLFDSVLGKRGRRLARDARARVRLGQAGGRPPSLRRSDGREFPCEVRFFPVALADGLEFSSFASDLTADRPLEVKEERLRQPACRA